MQASLGVAYSPPAGSGEVTNGLPTYSVSLNVGTALTPRLSFATSVIAGTAAGAGASGANRLFFVVAPSFTLAYALDLDYERNLAPQPGQRANAVGFGFVWIAAPGRRDSLVIVTLLARLNPQLPKVVAAIFAVVAVVWNVLDHRYWWALGLGLLFLFSSGWIRSLRPFTAALWNRLRAMNPFRV